MSDDLRADLAEIKTDVKWIIDAVKKWPEQCQRNRKKLTEGSDFALRVKYALMALTATAGGVLTIYGAIKAFGG